MPHAPLNVHEIMKMIGRLADCTSNPETLAALTALTEAVMVAGQGPPLIEPFAAAA